MTVREIIYYLLLAIANLILTTEWAKYGIWEIGIQRPINNKVVTGMIVGVGTVFIGGAMSRFADFNPMNRLAVGLVIGIPFLWIFIYRHVFLAPGLYDFNRAKIRTSYWKLMNLYHGKILEEQGLKLRNFSLAQNTVKMFKRSIAAQEKGSKVRTITKEINLSDIEISYERDIGAYCPICGMSLRVPTRIDGGIEGGCNMCGAILSARTISNILYLTAFSSKSITIVSDKNKENIGVAYVELAVLYRIMNLFKETWQALEEGMEITEVLLGKNPGSHSYLNLKSLILFRRAELNHAQGNLRQARQDYQTSLAIDRKLDDQDGIRTNEAALAELGTR